MSLFFRPDKRAKGLSVFYGLLIGVFVCLSISQASAVEGPVSSCHQLLGAEQQWLLQFQLPENVEAADDFIEKNADRFDLFPYIMLHKIKDLKHVYNDGLNNLKSYTGDYQGKNVFIKVLRSRTNYKFETESIREPLWISLLNRHGLGAQFLGMTKVAEHWALVFEHHPGQNSKNIDETPNLSVIQSIRSQVARLLDLGIDPMDLQFLVHEDQAVLIDTGWFYPDYDNQSVDKVLRHHFPRWSLPK